MKIGIITFHNVVNYGAVLQCYALQQKLIEWGYEVEVIDYENEHFKKFYSPFLVTKPFFRKFLYMIYAFRQKTVRRFKFGRFVKNYIGLSAEKYSKENIEKTNDIYDVFITGSDQVWNYSLTNEDANYFLKFVKNRKKISYAASIGMSSLNKEEKKVYKDLLDSFDSISVRENSAKEIVKDVLNKEVNVHIDPVLLLDKKEWSALCDENSAGDYIVVYKINKSKTYEAAERLAERTGLQVKVIQPDKTCKASFKKLKTASPRDFVSLFKNAKYVITDSFHGTVFSIIFQKQFAYFMDESANNRNSRIQNLLQKLHLQERNVKEIEEIGCIDNLIDYNLVTQILNEERMKSKKYLIDAIHQGE